MVFNACNFIIWASLSVDLEHLRTCLFSHNLTYLTGFKTQMSQKPSHKTLQKELRQEIFFFFFLDAESLCRPDWSGVAQSRLTMTSTSRV